MYVCFFWLGHAQLIASLGDDRATTMVVAKPHEGTMNFMTINVDKW